MYIGILLFICLEQKNLAPSWQHWFGTDDLGRDLFCRVCLGTSISLALGLLAALIETMIGILWGALANRWMMRICDILSAIPPLLIAILLTAFLGAGFTTILLGITLVGWVNMARIVYGHLLQQRQREYVLAARMTGASSLRITLRHIIPNIRSSILATMALSVPAAIFLEAFLSFMGLGISAPYASLGSLIYEGIGAVYSYPWRFFIPSAIMVLLCICFKFET